MIPEWFEKELEELRNLLIHLLKVYLTVFLVVLFLPLPVGSVETIPQILYRHVLRLVKRAEVIAFNPAHPFLAYVKIAFYVTTGITLPYILYKFWKYLQVALKPEEKAKVREYVKPFILLGCFGYIYGLLLVAPLALCGIQKVSMLALPVNPVYAVNELISLYYGSILMSALAMMTPPILISLAKLEVIPPEKLRKYRYHIYLAIFVLTSILDSEPFFITEILVTAPFIIAFELMLKKEAGKRK